MASFGEHKRSKSKKLQREDYFDLPTGNGEKRKGNEGNEGEKGLTFG